MTEEIEIRDITLPYLKRITDFIYTEEGTTLEVIQLQFGQGITFNIQSAYTRNGEIIKNITNYSWEDLLVEKQRWARELIYIFQDLEIELKTYDVFKEGTTPTVTINCSRNLAIVITDSTGLQVIQCSLTGYKKEGDVITIPNRKFGKITGENIESNTLKSQKVIDFSDIKNLHKLHYHTLTNLNRTAQASNAILKTSLKGSDIALIQHMFNLVCQDGLKYELDFNFLHDLAKKIENNTCT